MDDPIIGRWDITIQGQDGSMPSWLEVRKSGNKTLVGQFVAVVGSARPISKVEVNGNGFRFAIPPQWEQGANDLAVEGTLEMDALSGTITFPDGAKHSFTGKRAPALRPTVLPTWGDPVRLFNGRDLTGWHPLGATNQWQAASGILRSPKSGSNLATDRLFNDFKLHIEFRYPKGSNSGVYLRGRHEVQIEDTTSGEPGLGVIGAIYGFIAPSEIAAKPAGEWQTYDITLIGRMVTVVLNGKTVIANREIPGITGGALDSNEGDPGPIYLQGDHGPIEYRNITLTPTKSGTQVHSSAQR